MKRARRVGAGVALVAADAAALGRQHLLHQHRQPDPALRRSSRSASTCWSATPADSLGHAGLFGHGGLRRAAADAQAGLRPLRRRGRRRSRSPRRIAGGVRRAGAARHRHRLPDDHAGARPDRLGHRLSLGRASPTATTACQASTRPARSASTSATPTALLLRHARRVPRRLGRHGAVFVRSPFGASLRGTRDQARRMTALGYNVWLIRFSRSSSRGFWARRRRPAVPLLQPVHQPARGVADQLGRGAADGDLRRPRHAARADRSARPWS